MSTDRHKDISTVRRWLAHRGYGFIVADGGGQSNDIFVHIRHVQDGQELKPGARLSYHLAPDRRDPGKVQAVDVVVMGGQL